MKENKLFIHFFVIHETFFLYDFKYLYIQISIF